MAVYIDDITDSLVSRIKTIDDFKDSNDIPQVGLMVGGTEADRFVRQLTPPFAWIIYTGDNVIEPAIQDPYNCISQVLPIYDVRIVTKKEDENKIITEELTLLHRVVEAVMGQEAVPGSNWQYLGQRLLNMEGRFVWNQQYTVLTTLGNPSG